MTNYRPKASLFAKSISGRYCRGWTSSGVLVFKRTIGVKVKQRTSSAHEVNESDQMSFENRYETKNIKPELPLASAYYSTVPVSFRCLRLQWIEEPKRLLTQWRVRVRLMLCLIEKYVLCLFGDKILFYLVVILLTRAFYLYERYGAITLTIIIRSFENRRS